MDIDLRFFATFREAVGEKERTRTVADDATVGDVLASLEAEYEGLEGQLLADGEVRPQLSVLKNGRNVVHMEGVDTTLEAGDVVSVFPPVAGG
ncbi:MoaD family protein [Natrinema pellirubrum DSM 15624]|uniref:MoaD family protein n=2 Tax=Natrinema TaxID=88723 RepID=L0JN54_NATP1|nr:MULTISPECIES: ubiquitin-like small modifier protein 1 [Natrinema]ELZ10480.1 MoaD family protein [Natrinema thermotolerans DSM 11552]AGB32955.1 MoaD family protein [Natrinema pellirubrum DSM 15624]ELY75060.1 MoaD family protein [Natrinema pellirubrum DSM 15624]QCC58203.1 MoaD/ThiS family protein [Natrinema thermotolerans]WMT09314.1 MoaD/ThiS family protein [Natrinema thermotolerans]